MQLKCPMMKLITMKKLQKLQKLMNATKDNCPTFGSDFENQKLCTEKGTLLRDSTRTRYSAPEY